MWTWTCACGASFESHEVERVERKQRRHQNHHRQELLNLMGMAEPPEGWIPGWNCDRIPGGSRG